RQRASTRAPVLGWRPARAGAAGQAHVELAVRSERRFIGCRRLIDVAIRTERLDPLLWCALVLTGFADPATVAEQFVEGLRHELHGPPKPVTDDLLAGREVLQHLTEPPPPGAFAAHAGPEHRRVAQLVDGRLAIGGVHIGDLVTVRGVVASRG